MRRNSMLLVMFSILALWLSGCIISTSPSTSVPITLNVGASKTFTVSGFMNGPYEWSKNNVVIPGAITASYKYTALEADGGIFILKVQTKDSLSGKIIVKQWNVNVVTNLPPIANAGPDQNATPSIPVHLNGSSSSDPESQPLTFTWSITTAPAGSTATIDDPYIVNPTFTPDLVGGYTVTLIVSDGEKTATDTVTINASTGNRPPTAEAGPDQTVHLFRTVHLDGTGSSDPDPETVLTYAWTIDTKPTGSTSVILNPTSATPTFTPDKTGVYVIGLIVSDGLLTSGKDTLTITVTNTAPVANAGADVTVPLGGTATLNGSGSSDPDGDTLTFAWEITSAPAGSLAALSNAAIANPTFTPDIRGAYVMKLTVSDGDLTAEDTVIVTCSSNVPVANAGADASIEFGASAQLDGSASSDPDSDSLSFAWTITSGPDTGIGQLSNASIVNPVFTPSRKGIYTIQLIVTCSEGIVSAPDEVVITTTNHAPVAEAGDDITIAFPNKTAQLLGSGTDLDSDPLTYAWTIISAPAGSTAALSNTAIANPTFLPDRKGEYVIGLVVNDGEANSIQDTMKINVYNNAPTAEAGSDYSFTFGSGETITLDGSASSDPEASPLSYEWTITSAPYGSHAALLPGSNIVNPSITPDLPGTYVISLVVYDGDMYSAADSLTITAVNTGPTAEAGPNQQIGFPGVTANFDGTASHAPSGLPLSYTWEIATAPSGSVAALTGPSTATPSLTPDKKGVYVITLVVFDGYDYSPADALTLTVGDMPVANAGADQSLGFPGKTASLDGSASYDPNGTMIISWSWTITSAPAGSSAIITNPGLVNPTFSPDLVGVYVISLIVSDGAFFSSADTITITVTNHPPTAEAGSDQSIIFGYGAAANLDGSASSDPDGASLTYAWTVISAPSGSLAAITNPANVNASFIPDIQGVYVISLVVSDGYLFSSADTLTVTAANQAPTANAGTDINAAHGQTVALNGSGSTDPEGYPLSFAWTMISKPAGSAAVLSNAAIANPTFTADKSGVYELSLVVSDGVMTSTADTLTVNVTNNAPVAEAGADISLIYGYGALANLDGSLSSDPESQPLTYSWTITSRPAGSTAALSSSSIVNPTFLPDKAGVYTVSLVVFDGDMYSAADILTITATNQPPTAEAGDNQTVAWNTLATLNGSGTDPEAQPLTFAWAITTAPTGSTAALSNPAIANPTFTPNKTGAYVLTLTVSDGVNSASDTVTITVPNTAPTAEAGADQSIFFGLGASVTLNGSGSSDPEGDPLTYSWTITSAPVGSSAALSDPAAIAPSFTPDKKGAYVLSLTVSDGVNVSAADTVTITAYNLAPTANAGADINPLNVGTMATLNGSGTDPESQPLTYAWTITSAPAGSVAVLSNAAIANPSFTPDKPGAYVMSLIVSDGVNFSSADTMTITAPNRAPTAEAGEDQSIFFGLGATATLNGSGSSDPDNDALTYTWTIVSAPSGSSAALVNPSSVSPTLTPDKKGTYLISLVVSDGVNLSAPDAVTITAYNVAPTAEAGENQTVAWNTLATLNGSGTDPEAQPLTYAWTISSAPAGSHAALSNAAIANPAFTPDKTGAYVMSLIVSDGVNFSTADTVTITVPNTAPTAEAGSDQNILFGYGATATLNGSASHDPENDPLTYAWTITSAPSGSLAALSNPAIVNPTLTPDKQGVYVISLVVSDGVNLSAADTVSVTAGNLAPTANAGADQSVLFGYGASVTLSGSGIDPESQPLTYAWTITSAPAGSTAALSNTSIANPTFTPDKMGSYVMSLVVNDGVHSSAPDTMTITSGNLVPTAEAGANQNVLFGYGAAATLSGSGNDPESQPLTYAWTITSAPAGSVAALSNPAIANPTFVPDKLGAYVMSLTVSDGVNTSAADTVTITAYNAAPTANAGDNQTVTWNTLATLSGSGTDPESQPLTYAWTITSRPAGSVAALSNAAIANPTFTPDKSGAYVMSLVVSDGVNFSTPDTMTITVPNTAPIANAGADQNVLFGYGAIATLNGSASHDPEGEPLTYAWTITSRPAGSTVALSNPAIVNPSFTPDKMGAYVISLTVSDGVNLSTADTVTVTAYNAAPTAEAGDNQTVTWNTLATLSGSGTDPESQPLTYAWTITSAPAGSLASLSNPAIANPSFTPDKTGDYVFSLIVSDGVNTSSADTVTINVPNNAPTAEAGPNQNVLFGYGAVVTLSGSGTDPENQTLTYAWTITTRPAGSTVALSNPAIAGPSFIPDRAGEYVLSLVVSDGTNFSSADTLTVTAGNAAPTADAGANQDVVWNTLATLNGNGSFDPEGQPLSFAWTITSAPTGSTATLSGAATVSPTFTPDKSGQYVISLVVNDGVNSSAPDTVTITVANNAPTAEAGSDQSIFFGLGEAATLNGSGSHDPEGDPLTYHWTITSAPIGSAAALSDVNAISPSLTPDMKGVYLISLTVSDGVNVSAADSVTITAYNEAPTAEAGVDQIVVWNTLATLNGSGIDPESQPLTFAWTITSAPAGSVAALSNAAIANPTFTPDKSGAYVMSLTVNDGVNASSADTMTITVPNEAPTAEAGSDQSIFFGTGLTATLNGSGSHDPENETLIYTWAIVSAPSGSSAGLSNVNAIAPTLTPDRKGAYLISLTVSDGVNVSAADFVTITAYNDPPTAEAGPDQNPVYKGQTASLSGSGVDPESQPLYPTWSVISAPSGSTAQPVSTTIWNPTFTPDKKGAFTLRLSVFDGVNTTTDTMTITVPNRAPTAEAGANQSFVNGGTASLSGSGSSDPDSDTLTYAWSITGRPSGSTATLSNAAIVNPTFTPDKKGVYTIQLIVNDGTVSSAADTMTVTATNRAPVAEAGTNQSVYKNTLVNLSGSGSSDADGDALTYAWSVTARPSGSTAALSSTTIVNPTFRPDKSGSYTIQLIVNDGETNSAADTMTITASNRAPTAEAGTGNSALLYANRAVTLNGNGSSDPDGDTLTYAWTQTAGTTVTITNPNTMTPSFTIATPGTYTFSLVVNDGEASSAADTVTFTTSQATYTTGWESSLNDSNGVAWTAYKGSNMGTVGVNGNQKRSGSNGYQISDCNNFLGNCGSGYASVTNYAGKFVISMSAWFYTPVAEKFPADLAGIFEGTTERVHYGGNNSWTQYSWAPNRVVTDITLRMNGTGGATYISHSMYSDDISVTIWN